LRDASPHAWIVAEKILHPGEKLPPSWPVEGTTGYDFLNLVAGLFIHPSDEKPLADFYRAFTGEETDYALIAREKKHLVMHELLASDINRLTELMMQICERNRRYRDYTRYEVNQALRELIACFSVYRTYVRRGAEVREEDAKMVTEAIEAARGFRPELDPDLFLFLRGLLLLEHRGELEIEFVMRFQQLTGPVAAKGIEDTAFYCFNRFIALNEVGGDPARFGVSILDFHDAMVEASNQHPYTMLATSTHDTKRSEDVRARLALLSEIPDRWAEAVRRWSHHNETYRAENLPDRNAEYLLYQTLVGAWPIETGRVVTFMEKASREAKIRTSWTRPDLSYEERLRHFVKAVLEDSEFRSDLEGFVAPLVEPGRVNSLAQVLIKATAPGVPDFYQGTELWDLSLVDPDNRRPVDFVLRHRLLDELKSLTPEEILSRMGEGMPKLWVIHQALSLRKRLSQVFASGSYRPIDANGERAGHVVAFSRNEEVVTLVPRLLLSMGSGWEGSWVELPPGQWKNQLTGDDVSGGRTAVHDLLRRFPVALLSKER
jgi:(1->4)-alpha-D-glucan 1-alpha-D-glucosylmutase